MLANFVKTNVDERQSSNCLIVRSVFSVVGGVVSGFVVHYLGQRPVFQVLMCVLALTSFVGLAYTVGVFPPTVYSALLGFADGNSNTLTKSLFVFFIPKDRLTKSYALNGCFFNLVMFAMPPLAGYMADHINYPYQNAGSMWFYAIVAALGVGFSLGVFVRDHRVFKDLLASRD